MQCVAISRFDVGYILASISRGHPRTCWACPSTATTFSDGSGQAGNNSRPAISLTSDQLAELRALFELETALGLVLYDTASAFPTATTDLVSSAAAGVHLDTALVAAGPHTFHSRFHSRGSRNPAASVHRFLRAREDRSDHRRASPTNGASPIRRNGQRSRGVRATRRQSRRCGDCDHRHLAGAADR